MNDSALRTLFGKTGSGTTISLSDGLGKSNFTVGYSGGFVNGLVSEDVFFTGSPTGIGLRWNANGTMDQFHYSNGYTTLGETWGSPTTSGIGSNYWIRFTRTASGGPSANSYSTASTGWLQLNTGQGIYLQKSTGFNGMYATYTIEISSSSSGSPVLSTRTGIYLTTTDGYY
jgi:hypothetical protein